MENLYLPNRHPPDGLGITLGKRPNPVVGKSVRTPESLYRYRGVVID